MYKTRLKRNREWWRSYCNNLVFFQSFFYFVLFWLSSWMTIITRWRLIFILSFYSSISLYEKNKTESYWSFEDQLRWWFHFVSFFSPVSSFDVQYFLFNYMNGNKHKKKWNNLPCIVSLCACHHFLISKRKRKIYKKRQWFFVQSTNWNAHRRWVEFIDHFDTVGWSVGSTWKKTTSATITIYRPIDLSRMNKKKKWGTISGLFISWASVG